MAMEKVLDGKLYAGSPHMQFDVGDVVPPEMPRRGPLLYKKTVAFALFLMAAILPTIPLVADTETVNGITWTYTVSNGKASVGGGNSSSPAVPTTTTGSITIPSSLGGYSVTSIGSYAFYKCSSLSNVVIPDGITSIGYVAFRGCSSLASVVIPDGVTSIGNSAFRDCSSLSSVVISDGVTSIGISAFESCSSLSSVVIPDGVTSIENWTFYGCSSLSSVVIPDGVTNIGISAFYDCRSLVSVVIPAGVTNVDHSAFSSCNNLTSITCNGPYISAYGSIPGNKKIWHFKREYGAGYLAAIGVGNFYGFMDDSKVDVEIVSTKMREDNPTIMDVKYIAHSTNATVRLRALAFKDGVQSFTNIVRAVTFTDDTRMNVGDSVAANVTNTLSWRVAADWNTDLAQVAFGLIAMDDALLPLYLETVPATESHDPITFSWNRIADEDVLKALYWLVADGDEGLVVESGKLKTVSGGTVLAQGNVLSNAGAALTYLYGKMGYGVLSGADLTYVNTVSRLGLSPSGAIQYAAKKGNTAQ